MKYPTSCMYCLYWKGGCTKNVDPLECELVDLEEDIDGFDGTEELPALANHTDERLIADTYFQIQKLRVAIGNRIDAVMREADKGGPALERFRRWYAELVRMEKECVEEAKCYLKMHPCYEWLSTVKGVGPVLAMRMLSYIDIKKCDTISALWRYAGYAVINGQAEKPTKGEKLHYNKKLKTTMYLVGVSMLRAKSKFAEVYYKEKERQQQLHPELKPIIVHYRALRKMIKTFLACLWLVWRQAEGLPVRMPYAHEYLGHTTLYDPDYFAEKKKAKVA